MSRSVSHIPVAFDGPNSYVVLMRIGSRMNNSVLTTTRTRAWPVGCRLFELCCWSQLSSLRLESHLLRSPESLPSTFFPLAYLAYGEPIPVEGDRRVRTACSTRGIEAVDVTAIQRGVERWQPGEFVFPSVVQTSAVSSKRNRVPQTRLTR
jgi:hypothetical protein